MTGSDKTIIGVDGAGRIVHGAFHLGPGTHHADGCLTAASTWTRAPHGFLITRSKVVSDAPEHSFHPDRPRHPGGEPEAVAQALIRDTEPPAAVESPPWTGMSGFAWRDAPFAEYRDRRPGAAVSADRPRPSDEDARAYKVAAYRTGTDGWAPYAGQVRATHCPPPLHSSAGSRRTRRTRRREPTT